MQKKKERKRKKTKKKKEKKRTLDRIAFVLENKEEDTLFLESFDPSVFFLLRSRSHLPLIRGQ